MKHVVRLLIAFACAMSFIAAHAQSGFEPQRPVRFVVPFPPGGGTDAFARVVGRRLAEMWRHPVVVENRPGAQGGIGTAYAAKAAPDGHTLLLVHQGVFTVNPHLYPDTGFDPLNDFAFIGRGTQQPFVLVAHPSLPASSAKELVALAKRKPGALTFGSSSSGPQMAGELLKHVSGSDLTHVAYKGAAPAVVDVLAGTIDLLVANPTSVAQHIRTGKLRALVLFGKERIDVIPDAPTAIEAGFPELGDMPEWYGVAVPARTPSDVVARLSRDLASAMADAGVQQSIRQLGLVPSPSGADAFARQVRDEFDRWGVLVKRAGVKAQ